MQGNNVIPSNRLDFEANQKVFGYFYNFNAIIASVDIDCQATPHCNLQLCDSERIFGGLNCDNLAHNAQGPEGRLNKMRGYARLESNNLWLPQIPHCPELFKSLSLLFTYIKKIHQLQSKILQW